MKLNPYLSFAGNCEEAFQFYAELFGGTIEAMMTHRGTPAAEHVPPEWLDRIMHARLVFGEAVLMGGDGPPDHQATPQGFCVALQIKDPVEAERIFKGLAEGGTIQVPFEQTFWAHRFGMATDRFGIPWMVNCEVDA